ncbi:hypothetical protein BH11PSE3_BH11PSE3_05690 [soil metagenome]
MHRLVAGMLLIMLTPITAVVAQELPYGPNLTFEVYRNGEPIGKHTVTFQRNGPDLSVSTVVDFSVKMMGFTAYRYSHRAQEVWKGGAFQSLAAQTDDNGKTYAVQAQRKPSGIEVERNAQRDTLGPGVMPSSHWNFAQIGQSSLLNTQSGLQSRMQVAALGKETVKTATGSVAATHYRYSGDVHMDQWFDDRGRWVKTTFKAPDGSAIEYILQE